MLEDLIMAAKDITASKNAEEGAPISKIKEGGNFIKEEINDIREGLVKGTQKIIDLY